jgi:general secretion pathway protein D
LNELSLARHIVEVRLSEPTTNAKTATLFQTPPFSGSPSYVELAMKRLNLLVGYGGGVKFLVRLIGLSCLALVLSGCPKGRDAFSAGRIAENRHDFDSALEYYQRALQSHPSSVEYQVKVADISFKAAEAHIANGQKLREQGDFNSALFEFEKALSIDPASPIAVQQIRKTQEMVPAKRSAAAPSRPNETSGEKPELAEKPPEVMPLSRAPINVRMTNDAKAIIETIAKLAGLTVVFDPDFPARRISVDLTNVTLEQALEVVGVESKAFWAPMTSNIIIFVPDQPQKRRDFEDQVIRTFYLSNTVLPQELTEVVTGLRQLLDLKRIQQVNSRNAIVIRDTPAKLALAEKFIRDIDTAQPEVVIQVSVLQVRRDHLRALGISPDTSASLTFTPRAFSNSSKSSGNTALPLDELKHLSGGDYSIQLPGAAAQALLNDSSTQIIQDPRIRILDGQPAKLRIGDRVPVATGSFSAGTAATGVNPLVNTQFQYIDVGVIVDVTPRIHPSGEVSIKVAVEVSSVTGHVTIGSIDQPVISQRKIEHDVRLKEGEVNILGGLFDHTETSSVSGWPGLARVPLLGRVFSSEKVEKQEDEILILLTPHIVRVPEISEKQLRGMYSGTESNVQVRSVEKLGPPQKTESGGGGTPATPEVASASALNTAASQSGQLRFEPQTASLQVGESKKIAVVVDGAADLFSVPMLLQYDPAVLSVEEVRNGGFLSGGTQEIAVVERVDNQRGEAIISATRQPNTQGVGGTGTLIELLIKGVGPGSSKLAIVQVNARDSKQRPIPLVSSEASVQVR